MCIKIKQHDKSGDLYLARQQPLPAALVITSLELDRMWQYYIRRQLKRDHESFIVTKQDLKLLLQPWNGPYYTNYVADFAYSLSYLNFPLLSATTEKRSYFYQLRQNSSNLFLVFYFHSHWSCLFCQLAGLLQCTLYEPNQKPALAVCAELWDWVGFLNDTKTGAQNEARKASTSLQTTSYTV